MEPKLFAQAIVAIERKYGLRLDAQDAWFRLDGVPCGRGWMGTKPGCKRSKKKSGGGAPKMGKSSGGSSVGDRKTSNVAEIEIGRKAIGLDMLKRLDAAIAPEKRIDTKEIKILRDAFDKVFDDDPVGSWDSPESKALTAAEVKTYGIRQTAISVMAELQTSLFQIPRSKAESIAAKVQILKSASKHEAEVREHLADFIQMTGGMSAESFKKIKIDSARPYADIENGSVNLGRDVTPEARKTALFHEFGHIVEMNGGLNKITNKWLDQRATGPAVPMNKLSKLAAYDDDEIARPDHFVDPYVGKVYDTGETEVLSVGLERMASPQAMLKFYQSDPEHFFLTIGAIRK